MSFSALGLSKQLLKNVADQGYQKPYPIQEQVIPAILKGRDIMGLARTGSGKTAGFVLPILQRLQSQPPATGRSVRTLVLVPTRELAVQVAEVFQTFGRDLPRRVKTVAVFGGVSINPQMMALGGTDVVVATPGRLLDLISQNAVGLSAVSTLVLDEADKMLDLGFADEMTDLFRMLPRKRQTLLFSATLGGDVQTLREHLLRDPLWVEVEEQERDLSQIEQVAYRVSDERKGPLLRYLIKKEGMKQVLVFVSSVRTADNLVVKLNKNGIRAAAMHSQKSQGGRTGVLNQFKTGSLQVLVATDLLSRGIDIEALPHVVNFELPRSPKDYVHRIGRTGRADASGQAISLITPDDEHHFRVIQKKMGRWVDFIDSADFDLHGV
ncbi:DEAD/DEAH box helicase [Rudanella lutea]|uniref:DEAD/DEAH box helicase n=1 Tax=Rudanella lutea TaxID=451374 RepID=UPI000371BF8A|nr:DEAD/DEAH box helicase [Rudanella lutea]